LLRQKQYLLSRIPLPSREHPVALKILIADDNITAQNLGKKILTEAGYEVVAVSNGAAAMKKIASEKPALLVLDVYMPGYSGLEVCEKVKKAPETAQVPVLLTMGQMEALDPAESTRVKADGVITKPFVASDLLAVVQKLEEKLHPAAEAAPAEAVATMKMEAAAPDLGIQDADYEAWKAEAPEAAEAEAEVEERVSVPEGMGEAPAFGMEEMMEEAPPAAPPAVGMEEAVAEAPSGPPTAQGIPFLELEREAAAAEAPTTEIAAAPAPGVEFTSAPQGGEAKIEAAPELMVEEQHAEIAITRDAALVTDPSEMAREFVTKFGVENPEDIPVGVAMPEVSEEAAIAAIAEVPGEEAEPAHEAEVAAAAEAPAEAVAPAEEAQRESAAASLEEEMKRAMEAAPEPAPAPAPEPEAAAPPEPFEPEPEPVMPAPLPEVEAGGDDTQKLVAEFEAELQPAAEETPAEEAMEAAPAEAAAPSAAMDDERLAQAISRAMDRLRPQLIAEIARELKKN
jgi:CheY-like chemotaxis protein